MIRKAVMPIAGLARRMLPYSAAVPKAMLPLVRKDILRPVIHWILADVKSAGIDEVGIVASPDQVYMIEDYRKAAVEAGDEDLPEIHILVQDRPTGFGDAVLQAGEYVGSESFALLLGDHVYVSSDAPPCIAQVVGAYEEHSAMAMVGVQAVSETELCRVGTTAGVPMADRVYRCRAFVEKPSIDIARAQLRTSGLDEGQYLGHCGIYVFPPVIFDYLREIASIRATGGELELADAQKLLLERDSDSYFLFHISGQALDVGSPQGYAKAQKVFSSR